MQSFNSSCNIHSILNSFSSILGNLQIAVSPDNKIISNFKLLSKVKFDNISPFIPKTPVFSESFVSIEMRFNLGISIFLNSSEV